MSIPENWNALLPYSFVKLKAVKQSSIGVGTEFRSCGVVSS